MGRTLYPKDVDPTGATVESYKDLAERYAIRLLTSTLRRESLLGSRLGNQYGGKRDIYEALGYNKNPLFIDFWEKYKHQDIASRVINAPVQATWKGTPEVVVDGETWDAFDELAEDIKLYSFLTRTDTLSSIGQFSVCFIGYQDTNQSEPVKPVENAKDILFLRPYSEGNVEIKKWITDPSDERFGQPEIYTLKFGTDAEEVTQGDSNNSPPSGSFDAHWSRVIHVAQGKLEDEVFGIPQLESVFNRLDDLDKILGGSAEMYWRGAFPGYAFEADDNVDLTDEQVKKMNKEIEEYVHSLRRYIRLSGAQVKELVPQVTEPSKHVDTEIKMIAAAKGIPQRILSGSERGELASTQDEKNWFAKIDERREDFAEPELLRNFIDRAIDTGVLDDEDYEIIWPTLFTDEKAIAEIAKIKSETVKNYVSALGSDLIIPPERFLIDFIGYTEDQVKDIIDTTMDIIAEEEEEARQARITAAQLEQEQEAEVTA